VGEFRALFRSNSPVVLTKLSGLIVVSPEQGNSLEDRRTPEFYNQVVWPREALGVLETELWGLKGGASWMPEAMASHGYGEERDIRGRKRKARGRWG